MPVVVGRAVAPPNRPAFAERLLGAIHGVMRSTFRSFVPRTPGGGYGAACVHEFTDESLSVGLGEVWIGAAPQPPPDDDVPSIRCHG